MSDLGRCMRCDSRVKWDREANPTCPDCGALYVAPDNPGDRAEDTVTRLTEPACPKCQAQPGYPCRQRGGRITAEPHKTRAGVF